MRDERTKGIATSELPNAGGSLLVCVGADARRLASQGCSHRLQAHSPVSTLSIKLPSQGAPDGLVCPNGAELTAGAASIRHTHRAAVNSFILSILNTSGCRVDLLGRLIQLADVAYGLREIAAVDLVGHSLLRVSPGIASYYIGLAKQKQDLELSARMLERAVSTAPAHFRSRALLALGSVAEYRGDYQSEVALYLDSLKHCPDLFTFIEANRALAIAQSREGNHNGAVETLERLYPVARSCSTTHPRLFLDLLNSLAVELGEVGRVAEGRRIIAQVLRSPLATIYSEWQETRAELEQKDLTPVGVTVAAPALLPIGNTRPELRSDSERKSLRSTVERNAETKTCPTVRQVKTLPNVSRVSGRMAMSLSSKDSEPRPPFYPRIIRPIVAIIILVYLCSPIRAPSVSFRE